MRLLKVVLTRHGWLAAGRRPRAPAAAARSGGERRSCRERESHGSWRVYVRPRSPLVAVSPVSPVSPVSRGGLAALVSGGGVELDCSAAAAPLSIAPGVTRAGTACRSSYRPSRRRSRCDAYSPPNYYTTGLLRIKTSNLRATPQEINHSLILEL